MGESSIPSKGSLTIYAHPCEGYYSLGEHITTTSKGTAAIPLQWEKVNATNPIKAGVLPFPWRECYYALAYGRAVFPVKGVLLCMPIMGNAIFPFEGIVPLTAREYCYALALGKSEYYYSFRGSF